MSSRPEQPEERPALYASVDAAIRAVSELPVIVAPGLPIIVGPRVAPGGPCLHCLERALDDAGHAPPPSGADWPRPPAWNAQLIGVLAVAVRDGSLGRVYAVHPDGRVSAATLPAGTCGHCAPPLPVWTPDLHHSLRRGPLPEVPLSDLTHATLGPLLNVTLHPDLTTPHVVATAQLAARRAGQRVYGVGRDERPDRARTVAVLEALERYGGLHNHNAAGRRRDTLGVLGPKALDPRSVGLYAPDQYKQPGFPCTAFRPDLRRTWVPGYSLTRGRPVWVEESLVYYDADQEHPLVLNNSNGCALGRTREEAVIHGVLELVERDAALRWWRSGRPAIQLPLTTAPEADGRVLGFWRSRGYTVRAYDTTRLGIPSVVMVGVDPGHGQRGYAAGFASAAAFTMPEAISKGLGELSSVLGAREQRSEETQVRARQLSEHPGQVRTIDDHLLACSGEAARERFRTVLADSGHWPAPPPPPIDSLGGLLQLLDRQSLEVIAADQSAPLHAGLGLSCVRAFVPGLLGLSYGAGQERLDPAGHPWRNRSPHPFS